MSTDPKHSDTLQRQLGYFRERTRALGAQLFRADRLTSTLRHELEQKRRGFMLMAQLSAELRPGNTEQAFQIAARQLNSVLNMQRTLVLRAGAAGRFSLLMAHGYDAGPTASLSALDIILPPQLLDTTHPVRLTSEPAPDWLRQLAQDLLLPYFISVPVLVANKVVAVLLTGRVKEQAPFLSPLEDSDSETVQAIGGLLGAVLAQQQLHEVSYLANHDPLTGLPNKRLALDRLQQALLMGQRSGVNTALLFIDLDGFKAVNDTHGHDAGDELLRVLSRRLQDLMRLSDTVARLGGDEFIVIMPELGEPVQAEYIAKRVLTAVAEPLQIKGHRVVVGASIGIAYGRGHGDTPQALLQAADEAMYHVKHHNKNGYAVAPHRNQP
jgi:diguanylate cyclase (GGDEF)-like protein